MSWHGNQALKRVPPARCWRRLHLPLANLVLFAAVVFCQWAGPAPADEAISTADLKLVKRAEAERVQAIERVYGAVVAIYGNDRGGGGSGVLFDPAGYALTNHHVVAAAGDGGWAGLADGKLYRWKLIGTDPGGDLAIIRLEGREAFPSAPLGDSDRVRVGEWALAMGNPFNLAEDQRPTVTLGIVSGVRRFQEGAGLNQLVYGNCIQVDSSINPGNSGGPLFNLRGEVIGINGRGSFEERGRVNVGLGYAISSNQVKLFIPELLATKIAQHGTLDAVFGHRDEGVICTTLNLDAPLAKAGLVLGDRLLSFEGQEIKTANEFLNWISMYPAGWPAEVVYEHSGERRTAHVRLTPLPYEGRRPQEFSRPDLPRERLPNNQPFEQKPAEQKPGEQPDVPERPKLQVERPGLSLADAGSIRDKEVNRAIAQQIVSRWQEQFGGPRKKAIRIVTQLRRGDEAAGEQTLLLAPDGKIRADSTVDGRRTVVATDGKQCWIERPGQARQSIPRGKALLDPQFAQGIALATLAGFEPFAAWGDLALDGSDKAGGRLCYRLSVTNQETSEQLFVWLSVLGDAGQPRIELVKTGVGLSDDEPIASTLFDRSPSDSPVARPGRLVRGLAETVELTMEPGEVSELDVVPASEFSTKP